VIRAARAAGRLLAVAVAAACGPTPHAAAPKPSPAAPPRFGGLDAYGSPKLDAAALAALEPDARALVATVDEAEARRLQDSLLARVNALGDFAFVQPSLVTYYPPDGQVAYLTIDVVERADGARRLRFCAAPTGKHADPAGLVAAWRAYQDKYFELLQQGKVAAENKPCPAWHCLGDPTDPALRAWAEKFVTDVPAHGDELAAILADDADARARAAAAFLLAYLPDGKRVVALELAALDDPEAEVRNNAMRVLAFIAMEHADLDVPIEPILPALDGPLTTDRNKALAIVAGLVHRPGGVEKYRAAIVGAGDVLLRLLALQQPNNHDFAWDILRTVSGQELDERDLDGYAAWLRNQRAP
jgi:hypothetical protein